MSADERDPRAIAEDRRRFERIPIRIAVKFREAHDAARALRAYSLNFSAGGLCLRTQRPYAVGDRLALTLSVEGEDFSCAGRVAWVRAGVAIGVRFEDLHEQDRRKLEQLLQMLKK